MKITVTKNQEVKPTKYPCVKQSYNGSIVYFTAPKTGLCLRAGDFRVPFTNLRPAGFFGDNWAERNYSPLVGSITLEND